MPQTPTTTPTILVLFGMTGDLARKKIIPSLWHLFTKNRLPEKLAVIGVARTPMNEVEVRTYIGKVLSEKFKDVDENNLHGFCERFTYIPGDTNDETTFNKLSHQIDNIEKEWGVCTNKLFYLSLPPSAYEDTFKNLAGVGLNLPCGDETGWSRVLVEKPFGHDQKSAAELQALLSTYFKEEQIYRIDHYLFKEIIQGIENFRFSNNLFEHTWDNRAIERIDIKLLESIGAEDRGRFYDSVGALKDVGQNHTLMMLAAVTMEYIDSMSSNTVRSGRASIIGSLREWDEENLRQNTYRAQYEGYQDIEGVEPNSQTETYFAARTELDHPRWSGVPIYIEAGKRTGDAQKEIVLTLKHPEQCEMCAVGNHGPNKIIFRLAPNDEIVIHFWTKKPGFEFELEEREFSFFLYEKETKVQYVEEYAKVLYAAIQGEQEMFISEDEVKTLWKFSDPISAAWENNMVPLHTYKPDTKPEPELAGKVSDEPNIETIDRQIGIVGLGKMGANLSRRLLDHNWKVVGYNQDESVTTSLAEEGISGATDIKNLVEQIPTPRTVWLMVPHAVVDEVLEELTPLLDEGDTVIDGGNSNFKESVRRGAELKEKNINFLDVGVSGGPEGARHGSCLMIGGEEVVYEKHIQLFENLATTDGYAYMGDSGAGHFVKMVHNGIEYGMMQAIAEGFAVMKQSDFDLDMEKISHVYNHGSVIESRLIGWLRDAYIKYGSDLNSDDCCSSSVSHSGEGQWTVDTAKEMGIPVKIIEGALEFRKQSQDSPSYTGQVVSALRHEFGGHNTKPKE